MGIWRSAVYFFFSKTSIYFSICIMMLAKRHHRENKTSLGCLPSVAKENILKSKQYPVVYLVILDVYEKVCLFLLPLAFFSLSLAPRNLRRIYICTKNSPWQLLLENMTGATKHARKSSFCFVILFILSFPPLSTYLSKLFCRDSLSTRAH